MSDVYRKVGRGGAGNYMSQSQVDAVEQAHAEATHEIETHRANANANANAAATHKHGAPMTNAEDLFARAGRGGAGNFVDPASLPDKSEQETGVDKTQNAVSASIARGSVKPAYSGRGGAGNWTVAAAGQVNGSGSGKSAEEARRGEDLERKIVEDVDAGLAKPGKAYNGGRGDRVKGDQGEGGEE